MNRLITILIFNFLCSQDQDVISAAKMNGIDLPSSCCLGVCTAVSYTHLRAHET